MYLDDSSLIISSITEVTIKFLVAADAVACTREDYPHSMVSYNSWAIPECKASELKLHYFIAKINELRLERLELKMTRRWNGNVPNVHSTQALLSDIRQRTT